MKDENLENKEDKNELKDNELVETKISNESFVKENKEEV